MLYLVSNPLQPWLKLRCQVARLLIHANMHSAVQIAYKSICACVSLSPTQVHRHTHTQAYCMVKQTCKQYTTAVKYNHIIHVDFTLQS